MVVNLFIKAVNDNPLVESFYKDHGTFHKGDAGLDIFNLQEITIPPRSHSIRVPLGICIAAYTPPDDPRSPTSVEGLGRPTSVYMYPRSSTGSKTPIRLSNSVGIIDAGYRGELFAFVDNISNQSFVLKRGERYFQLCEPTLQPLTFKLVNELTATSRGSGGFGSTG